MKFNDEVSRQPRKTRRNAYQLVVAPRVHLSEELRKKEGKRSMRVRKGDAVKALRGAFKGKSGKVTRVQLKLSRVFVEGLVQKKQSGQEKMAPLEPSNLVITSLVERKGSK